MENHYVYLLQEREFINSNMPIYKIGKTKQANLNRFKSYPKGSELLCQLSCKDCSNIEKEIINLFDKKYVKMRNIGAEYYEGNIDFMILDIMKIVENEILCTIKNKLENMGNDKEEINKNTVINEMQEIREKMKIVENVLVEKEKETDKLKTNKNYHCGKCVFTTQNKKRFEMHLQTNKHKKVEDENKKHYNCPNCQKIFNTREAVWHHKKKCQK